MDGFLVTQGASPKSAFASRTDCERSDITVREGKGDKDWVTTVPGTGVHSLQEHLRRVQAIHQRDLADGYDRVELPSFAS